MDLLSAINFISSVNIRRQFDMVNRSMCWRREKAVFCARLLIYSRRRATARASSDPTAEIACSFEPLLGHLSACLLCQVAAAARWSMRDTNTRLN